jgi:mycoredoxin
LTEATIQLFGNKWCPDCRRARLYLENNSISYLFTDVEADPEVKKRVIEINHGYCSVPTILFPDGTILTEPSNQVLDQKITQLRNDGLI